MKPTIYDIKYQTQEHSPFYFSRKTLKFFGQTMRDFKVAVSPKGNTYIYAPSYWLDHDSGKPRFMGYTFSQVINNKIQSVISNVNPRDLEDILRFIKDN